MTKAENALRWIIGLLKKHKSPYQIIGGAAAIAYGSNRELADLDIYIPREKLDEVMNEIKPFIFWGPENYQDENWNLYFAKLDYHGQKLDIGDGDSIQMLDKKTGKVIINGLDFTNPETRELFGVSVSVIPKERLIEYKSAVDREVDRIDIEQIK